MENENSIQTDELIEPREEYRISLTAEDMKNIFRLQMRKRYIKSAVLIIALAIFIPSCAYSYGDNFSVGLFAGMYLLAIVIMVINLFTAKRKWQSSADMVVKNRYEYLFYDDYLIINIYRYGEKTSELKVYFKDISAVFLLNDWLIFNCGGLNYIIRKDMLKENSVLYSYMYHNPGKIKNIGSAGRRGVISTVLFLASLLTLFAAIALAGFMTGDDGDLYKNMWVFFCFTPIPLSSLIYGFVLKAKDCKYKKNVIIGIIMTILLCIYGSFSFIY